MRKGMKFGVEVPNNVKEALALDKKNGNTYWQDAISKEMKNARVAFELLDLDASCPEGYKKITCHLIFDVKMDLTRKARYVAGGHLTDPPSFLTYASVVSRDTVRIGPADGHSGNHVPPIRPSHTTSSNSTPERFNEEEVKSTRWERHCFIRGPARSSAPAARASSARPSLPLNPNLPPNPASGLTTMPRRMTIA